MEIFDRHKGKNRFLTIANWIGSYNRDLLGSDALAGLTVGIMLVPQAMAYAMVAGMPPVYGLYASMVILAIYPFFGTSRHMATGVMAVDMVIIAAGVGRITAPGSEYYIGLVALLALFTGVIQLLMSAGKLGFLANYISKPVITGFAAAVALIIIFNQLGNLLGITLEDSRHLHETLGDVYRNIGGINAYTLATAAACAALLIVLKLWKPLFPSSLALILLSALASWWLDLPGRGVKVVGDISGGFPKPALPPLSPGVLRDLFSVAITLTLVQFMNVASIAKTYSARHGYSVDPNRELFTLGLSNTAAGLLSGMPVSASFSRTAVNEQAGARTPAANFFSALLLMVTLLFLTPLFKYLPYAVLGVVVMLAAVRLLDIQGMRALHKIKKLDGFIAVLTFAITIAVGIQEGILVGIAASVFAVLYRESKPNAAELGHIPGTTSFRDIERFGEAGKIENILLLRVDASFSFTNAEYFKDFVLGKCRDCEEAVEAVIIDGSAINDLDTTALESIKLVIDTLERWNIEFYLTGLKGPVRDTMRRDGLYQGLEKDHLFDSAHHAVSQVLRKWDREKEDGGRFEDYRGRTCQDGREEKE